MKIFLFLVLSITISSSVWAGEFTIISTPEQDTVLNIMLTKINEDRALVNPPKPPTTMDKMVDRIVKDLFKKFVDGNKRESFQELRKSWNSATSVEKDLIKTILRMP